MTGHGSRVTRRGRVQSYDAAAGYGMIVDDGAVGEPGEWFFHCTAIADGSREISMDAPVTFLLVPGHRGRYEATDIRTV